MRLHVALTPGEFTDAPLAGRTAFAVDVLRATTAAVAACEAGCRRLVPVPDAVAAEAMAAHDRMDTVVAGERGGEAIAGFDLGNSPSEFTPERVGGRVVVLTTTNGTAAMLTAARAAGAALAALTNVSAAARWALRQERDVTVLCAGDSGALALEDVVCAGLLVARLSAAVPGAALSGGATAALALARHYEGRLDHIGRDSQWGLKLRRLGREADLVLCLRADVSAMVPVYAGGGFSAEPGAARLTADGAGARPGAGA